MANTRDTVLVQCGRDIAGNDIRAAIATAENSDQMNNQIVILYRAAVTFLAHFQINQAVPDFEKLLAEDVKDEIEFFKTCGHDGEWLTPGGGVLPENKTEH